MIPWWNPKWWTSPSFRLRWAWKKYVFPGMVEGIKAGMNTQGDAELFDSKAFSARYAGYCNAECGDRIEPGQRVMYVGTLLVHEACAASAPVAGADEKPTKFQGTTLDEMGY